MRTGIRIVKGQTGDTIKPRRTIFIENFVSGGKIGNAQRLLVIAFVPIAC